MPEIPTQPTSNQKSINWKNILIVAVIGAVVIGLGVLIFLILQPKPKETTPTTAPKTATTSAKKDETADWKVYTSEVLEITIKYPKDWAFKDGKGTVVFGKNPGDPTDPIQIDISRVSKDSKSQQGYEKYAKMSVNVPISSSFHGTSNYTTRTRLPNVTIDSTSWIKVKTTHIQDDVLNNSIILTTEKDNYYYTIALVAGKSAFLESNSKLFDLMSSTFRFKKSSWVVYTNKDLGFSLRLPNNFTTNNDMVYFWGPTQEQGTDFHDGLSISFSVLNKVNDSLNSLRNTAEADMKRDLLQTSIGSGKAAYYTDLSNQGSDVSTKVIFTELNDGRILKIQAIHGGAKDKEYLILLNQILSTFKSLD